MPTSQELLREALLARVITDYATLEAEHCGEDAEMESSSLDDLEVPSQEELWGLVPDPDSCPPQGAEWLVELPCELLDEYFAATAPPDSPAALPAGFWHSSQGDGYGFASGGTSNTLPPGPVLTGLAARAWDDGLDQLDDDAVVGVLCAARRLTSWAAALELTAAANLANRRSAAEEAGQTGLVEHVDDEFAAALTLTGRAAGRLLDLALTLDRLPATMAALRAGEIDPPRAAIIADETALLGGAHRAAVEKHLLRRASGQTTGELRAAAKRAVIAADPSAARKRKEKAQREARVERWEEDAGTAALAGRDLPPAGVLAADQHLSGIARSLKEAGVEGTMDNLRALAYLTLLAGQPLSALFPAAPDPGGADPAGRRSRSSPPTAGAGRAGAATAGPTPEAGSHTGDPATTGSPDAGSPDAGSRAARSPAARSPAMTSQATSSQATTSQATGAHAKSPMARFALPPLTGTVNLTMPLATWLGISDAPGSASGYGPLDASDARLIGTALAERADTTWCITLTDAEGRPAAHGCTSPRSRAGRQQGARATGSRGAPGQPSNAIKTPGDPAAATVSDAPGRGKHGAGQPGTGTATSRAGPGWDGSAWNFAITPLPGSPCDHLRETTAYQASPGLRHVLEIRHATCTYPGCRRAAERCDLDHAVPYDRGGRTCTCNLGPRCRRHHKAKQTPGWRLVQTSPGDVTWTTPSGRSYTTRATQYPN
ncbi:MAG TPA: DUF222 domain-containing protein [Streptosporangiaceae bacterium]